MRGGWRQWGPHPKPFPLSQPIRHTQPHQVHSPIATYSKCPHVYNPDVQIHTEPGVLTHQTHDHTQTHSTKHSDPSYLDVYTLTSNMTHTHPVRHTPQTWNQTQPAHNNTSRRHSEAGPGVGSKGISTHHCSHHMHTRVLSITLTCHCNPISPDFLPINQGGAAALWGQIDSSN